MKATAFIVGPEDGPGAALRHLSLDLGFAHALPFQGLGRAEQQLQQTPVCFFLFAAVGDIATLAPTAHMIRFCNSRRLRFSPLIYFSESSSAEAIRACVNMGFDDVITLPFTHERVIGRLEHQLERPVVFYETPNYVGPDRRGGARADSGQHRRIDVLRRLSTGVIVLKDQTSARRSAAAAA